MPRHPARPAGQAHRHIGPQCQRQPSPALGRRVQPPQPAQQPQVPPPRRPSRRRCPRRPAGSCSAPAAPRGHAGRLPMPARRAARDCQARRPARRRRARRRPATACPTARRSQHVADAGEHHQAVEQVVAVGAPAGDMQEQIDLGRRGLGQAVRTIALLAADHGGSGYRFAASPPAWPRRPARD